MPRSKPATPIQTPRRRSALQRVLRWGAMLIDILAVCALALTGYAGNVSPLKYGGYWGILPLCFPGVLLICTLLLIGQLFWHRRGAVVIFLGMIACSGPILTYSPLHICTPKIPAGAESFTFLTYNVHNFIAPGTTENTDTVHNGQIDFIINSGADIVCLQEATYIGTLRKGFLSASQIEAIHAAYPNAHIDGNELAVLSKFPIQAIHLDANRDNFKGGIVTCYRVTLPSGRLITLFNVHLESMKLAPDDRQVYMELTELHRQGIEEVKDQLLRKVSTAAVSRAQQAQQLLRYIRLYGGPDVILSGDFNDVPGCYAIRTLEDAGFKDVYPQIGFGPMVTFNDNRLYFCIDHTMYRGALVPVEMTKGKLKASDHYPLLTRFYLDK